VDLQYPGFGWIVVDGTRYDHDVVISAGVVRARDKGPSRALAQEHGHTPLAAAEDIPWGRRLVIGTGHSGRLPVVGDVVAEARRRGIELVAVPTAEACALLREVDPSDVYAVLHVTC
jgi:hypothetical protein